MLRRPNVDGVEPPSSSSSADGTRRRTIFPFSFLGRRRTIFPFSFLGQRRTRGSHKVQCNVFSGASGEVALTAAGGLRKLSGVTDNYENAALVGVHYGGKFYEFVPWNGTVSWEISRWGYWHISAENDQNLVELVATTEEAGTPLRAPTQEAGLVTACTDTCYGDLRLQLWEKTSDGNKGKLILEATSNMAAVEVGGGPWFSTWKGTTSMPDLLCRALQVPIDVESFFPIPFFKPPGL